MTTKRGPTATDIEIGKRLHALRRENDLSQSDLAVALRISYQQLQKYERDINRVSAARLYEIAMFFDALISSFFPAYLPGTKQLQSARLNDDAMTIALMLVGLPADLKAHIIALIKAIQR